MTLNMTVTEISHDDFRKICPSTDEELEIMRVASMTTTDKLLSEYPKLTATQLNDILSDDAEQSVDAIHDRMLRRFVEEGR